LTSGTVVVCFICNRCKAKR